MQTPRREGEREAPNLTTPVFCAPKLTVVKFDNKVIDVQIPNSMILEVTQTDTGLKGNTAKVVERSDARPNLLSSDPYGTSLLHRR